MDTWISQGLDLDRKRHSGLSCLVGVIEKQHTPGLTLLLKKGADPLFRRRNGETPLFKATSQAWSKGIKILLEYIPKQCTGICRDELRREISRAEAKSASNKKWKNVNTSKTFTSII